MLGHDNNKNKKQCRTYDIVSRTYNIVSRMYYKVSRTCDIVSRSLRLAKLHGKVV